MSSSQLWRTQGVVGSQTTLNKTIAVDANALLTLLVQPTTDNIILGDYSKWCSSLIAFPYNVHKGSTKGKLKFITNVFTSSTDVDAWDIPIAIKQNEEYLNNEYGYTLGQYLILPHFNSFLDYEPYSKLELYLPYYGFVQVKLADALNNYIQIFLKVDYTTGQALYTIAISGQQITYPYAPSTVGMQGLVGRVLSKHTFKLGSQIPFSSVGMIDSIRNTAMSALKFAGGIASSGIGEAKGYTQQNTTTTKTIKRKNKSTGGRMKIVGKETTTKTVDSSNFSKQNRLNQCFEVGSDVLGNMNFSVQSDKPNDNFVDMNDCRSVKILRYRPKVNTVTDEYKHIYGQPLGDVRILSQIEGYTEIANLHIEGDGFKTATREELAIIGEMFNDGVILPPKIVVPET